MLSPTDTPTTPTRKSAFNELGLKGAIEALSEEIRELYASDDVPWIIGYSGGKDSTATLQLIWMALAGLPVEQRKKTVHVISTDTLVENPVVAAWVTRSLDAMGAAAAKQEIPIKPHRLTPRLEDSFWVNLIGRGYPAPRHKFRWCTERLKIKPSTRFILGVVKASGEAILVLGSRKAESSRRSANMTKHERRRVRDRLSPNAGLPGTLVYTPIEDWANDDVWMFLTQCANPWGYNNADLLGMYAGASADGECPLVVDTSTPSCGDSRFGCWVCTLVEKDKSMSAMIHNDAEKEWMLPLLKLRNKLDFRRKKTEDLSEGQRISENSASDDPENGSEENSSDRHLRDFRRMSGAIQTMKDGRVIPGPYLQSAREEWLRDLLAAQTRIRKTGPEDVRSIELITLEELQEIRRIWVVDKHEMEDSLPRVYEEVTGEKYPGPRLDDSMAIHAGDLALLKEACGDDGLHYELTRELLGVTRQGRASQRRAGHYERLEKTFGKHYYDNQEEAVAFAQKRDQRRAVLKVAETADTEGTNS
jgi:DNA sulfur modification protein DndC